MQVEVITFIGDGIIFGAFPVQLRVYISEALEPNCDLAAGKKITS